MLCILGVRQALSTPVNGGQKNEVNLAGPVARTKCITETIRGLILFLSIKGVYDD